MSKFNIVNGGVVPRLDSSNFFGWHQAILDAAYAGGRINVLNSKSLRPIDPSTTPELNVKFKSVMPDAAPFPVSAADSSLLDAPRASDEFNSKGVVGSDEVVEVDARGKVISMDQRRREFLVWERQNFEARSLLLKSVDESFHWA